MSKLKGDLELNKVSFEHKKKQIEENNVKISKFQEERAPEMSVVFNQELVKKLEEEKGALEEEQRTVLNKVQELKTKKGMADELKNKISGLNNCPTCLQEVKEEHKSRIITEEENRVKVIENALVNFTNKKEEFENRVKELLLKVEEEKKKETEFRVQKLKVEQYDEKVKEILTLKDKIEGLQKEIVRLDSLNLEISKKIKEIGSIDEIYAKIKGDFETLDKEFRKKELEKKEMEVKIRMIKENILGLEEEIKKKQEVRAKVEYLNKIQNWLDSYFVNLMENMEKNVMFKVHEDFNSLFEKWFGILVDNENLQMTLDEEFSPRIFQNGYDIEYDYLSGGEKTAGALAYRLSLNQVINNIMSSIKTKDLLILDEPTDGFSSEQLDRMKVLMEEIDIGQIIIVSHESKVESFVDNIIKFDKIDHCTNVLA